MEPSDSADLIMPAKCEKAHAFQKALAFQYLHMHPGTFLMPNAWDAGSARLPAAEGFAVLGTSGTGIAFAPVS